MAADAVKRNIDGPGGGPVREGRLPTRGTAVPSKVTLADVARAAEVSEITVSRVLRAKGPISETTRLKVEQAVHAVGYVPNRIAGALASAATDLIGVVVPSLDNIVFPDVLRGIDTAVSSSGLRVVMGVSGYDPEAEQALIRSLLSWRPAALIVTGLEHTAESRAMLAGSGTIVVEIMDIDGPALDIAIGISHRRAGEAMARHLTGRGYRRIGYVGHDLRRDRRAAHRREGFSAGLRDTGLTLTGEIVVEAPSSTMRGRQALARLIGQWPAVEAVYFSNDDMAVGGYFHCLDAGLSVPDQMALAGFNGLELGQTLPKPLTTTLTRRFDIGRLAGEAVLSRMRGRPVDTLVDVGFDLIPGATA
ncbi:MAG: LacI family DNA-binding transcriptional regulator, partial [Rhizobiaceae bacterium]|nr:LacI family DNA-binding transcriptional regulator [Rhizobiaceae bacterium]